MTLVQKELQNAYIGEYVPPIPYLCFTANTAGSTVKLNKNGSPTSVTLETSTDGTNWSTYTIGNTITLSNIGDKVYFRNTSENNTGFSTSTSDYYKFVMTGSILGSGDINYLINKNSIDTVGDYGYRLLFQNCTSLITPPNLPATSVGYYSYTNMFQNTGITTVPKLPATSISQYSYMSMFYGCTQLEALPKLDIVSIPDNAYRAMFQECTKIKLSTTQTGEYQTEYRMPTTGTGTAGASTFFNMFNNTGGTFTGTPSINTTYYTSNTVI